MSAFPEDLPDGPALLDLARRHLVDALLPLLPEDRKLDVLMIANAMAIAGREARMGHAPLGEALARLAAIYEEAVSQAVSAAEVRDRLARLNRRLAQDIRAGAFDTGPKRAAVLDHLRATTRARLAVANPKVLE